MKNTGRNAPCPCGSGKKYKNCCINKERGILDDLQPGLRMKGGVRYDPDAGGLFVIVHTCDNVAAIGEPNEWRYDQRFDDEEAALHFYKQQIRPGMLRLMEQFRREAGEGGGVFYRPLE